MRLLPLLGGRSARISVILAAILIGEVALGQPVSVSFRRGDVNADGTTDISDGIAALNFQFIGGETPPCLAAADVDDNGTIEITDGIRVLNFLFLQGLAPEPPFEACGEDPSPDELGCGSFTPCGGGEKDTDGDKVPDTQDNCLTVRNPLQVDLDLDKVGDDCDNCPTQFNPNQEDANRDGGGDACAPPVEISHCGTPFVPKAGLAPELLDPAFVHPTQEGIVHPVVQFSSSLMTEHRLALGRFKIRSFEPIAFNLVLVGIPQNELQSLIQQPFVRSIFPLPIACRLGGELGCPALDHAAWRLMRTEQSPEPRARHAMAYDAKRRETVLFGGLGQKGPLGDTWLWDGAVWRLAKPEQSPSPRREHAMAYDEERGLTVLFGGVAFERNQDVLSNETWLWDGKNWRQIETDGPIPRSSHAMAFDRANGGVLLFGGLDKGSTPLDDTWFWDGERWRPVRTDGSPSPRAEHAMATDTGRREIVLFGGVVKEEIMGDTWIWTGKNWELRKSDEKLPPPLMGHAMASVEFACGVVMFGGETRGSRLLAETWFWDGLAWRLVDAIGNIKPRSETALAYDRARRRVVLFGGAAEREQFFGETWELEPAHVVEVRFSQDVSAGAAESILTDHDAVVIQRGVVIGGGNRVNSWQTVVADSQLGALAGEEPVLHTQLVGPVQDTNNGGRPGIGVDVAQAAPFCGGAGCNGTGIVLSQWETRWAPGDATGPGLPTGNTHAALAGRVTVRDRPVLAGPAAPAGCGASIVCNACTYSGHATHVCGTMMGSGAGNNAMRGMAVAATNISYNLPNSVAELACELTDANQNFGARLSNNSWGAQPNAATQAQYDAFSQGYDQQIATAPALAVLFAAGNAQCFRGAGAVVLPAIYTAPSTGGACTPMPAGIAAPPAIAEPAGVVRNRFFSVSGGRGTVAKNTLAIGAINSGAPSVAGNLGRMTSFSAWGPTQDGRIKPDLVAPGGESNTQDGVAQGGVCFLNALDTDPRITSTDCTQTDAADNCLSVAGGIYNARSGTSMSTPAATGAAALVLQQQGVTGLVPSDVALDSDSIKALLVHTATDLQVHFPLGGAFMTLQDCDGDLVNDDCWPVSAIAPGVVQDGPDYVNGWGLINIPAALQKVQTGNPSITLQPTSCPNNVVFANLPFNSPLAVGGDPASIGIGGCGTTAIWDWVAYTNVPAGTTQLKVTIAWDDQASPPPGAGATASLLVSDLDLIVTPGTGMGGSFNPTGPHNYSWRLDPACPYLQAVPVVTNTWDPATYADHRNNVEQVIVANPPAGQWRVVVQSIGLTTPQPFAIMISMPPTVP